MKLNRYIYAIMGLIAIVGCEGLSGKAPVTPTSQQTPRTVLNLPSPTPLPEIGSGQTILSGTIAIQSELLILEATDNLNSFRKAIEPSGSTYRLTGIPVGRQVRIQVQYRKNPHVILSGRKDIAATQANQDTSFNITLESTAIDLIYERAANLGKTTITNTPVQTLETKPELKPSIDAVIQVLQTIMATPLDNIQVTVPSAPSLIQKIDELLPTIENILNGTSVPVPTPTLSATVGSTPAPTATATPATSFVATQIRIKPASKIKVAKDKPIQFWVVEVDAQGQERAVTATWLNPTSTVATISTSGLLNPLQPGSTLFTAQVGTFKDSLEVTVTEGEVASIDLIPDKDFSIDSGRKFEMQAKGTDTKNNEILVTPSWSVDVNSVASIDANGVLSAFQVGTIKVTGSFGSFSKSVTVHVDSGSSRFIDILPKQPVVLTGKSQLFQVLHRDLNDNISQPLFDFSVDNTAIGSISSASGIFTAKSNGTASVTILDTTSEVSASTTVTVADGVPYISQMSPSIVVPGQSVVLTGQNFATSTSANKVDFNGTPATVTSATATTLNVTIPASIISGFVSVTSDGKKGNAVKYVVDPKITSISPNGATPGSTITITGDHFDATTPAFNVIFFGSIRAPIPTAVTRTSMNVVVPSGVNSSSDVKVLVRGDSSNIVSFTPSNKVTWKEKKSAPTARAFVNAETINSKIYVLGSDQSGLGQVLEVYDPSPDNWSTKKTMPTNRTLFATAVENGKLYTIGGANASTTVESYDPDSDSWSTKGQLNAGRSNLMAETYNGKIYAIGGTGSNNAGKKVEQYDPNTNTWTLKSESPSERFNAATAVFGERIYVFGGGTPAVATVTAYLPDSNSWETNFSNMPVPRSHATAVVVNNKIYLIGGYNEFQQEQSTAFEFTPGGSGSWITVDSLPAPRAAGGASVYNNEIFYVGGWPSEGSPVSTLYKGQF